MLLIFKQISFYYIELTLTLPFNNIKIIIHEKSSIVYLFSI